MKKTSEKKVLKPVLKTAEKPEKISKKPAKIESITKQVLNAVKPVIDAEKKTEKTAEIKNTGKNLYNELEFFNFSSNCIGAGGVFHALMNCKKHAELLKIKTDSGVFVCESYLKNLLKKFSMYCLPCKCSSRGITFTYCKKCDTYEVSLTENKKTVRSCACNGFKMVSGKNLIHTGKNKTGNEYKFEIKGR